MKWKPISMRGDPPAIVAWVAIALVSPFLLPILALVCFDRWKSRVFGPSADWRPWFAWHPVEVWPRDEEPKTVWLEWIERRQRAFLHTTDYRSRP